VNGKKQRFSVIERILRKEIVRSQCELQKALTDSGFMVTQATLSRDIRQMKIVKKPDRDGLYRYILPDMETKEKRLPTALFNDLTCEFSGNLAVIKTRPGYAMSVASFIDEQTPTEILGTIAGDDTILVIPRDGFTRSQVEETIKQLIINN